MEVSGCSAHPLTPSVHSSFVCGLEQSRKPPAAKVPVCCAGDGRDFNWSSCCCNTVRSVPLKFFSADQKKQINSVNI
jgi:hypothetical protein